jgi:thioester reductase-like protein
MERKNILLIGATGFVGSNLAPHLLSQGHKLCCLIRPNRPLPHDALRSVFLPLLAHRQSNGKKSQIEIVEGDITKPGLGLARRVAQRLLHETDEVWHCAALLNFEESKRIETRQVNFLGTKHVLEFIKAGRVKRFHYLSTAYVVGQHQGLATETFPDKAKVFKNTYEQTKWMAENLINAHSLCSEPGATIYRPSIIMGDSQPGKVGASGLYTAARIIAAVGKKYGLAKVGKSAHILRIPGDRRCVLNLVPIDYVAQAAGVISDSESSHGKIYHLVNPVPTPNEEIIGALSDALGLRIVLADQEDFAAEPMRPYEKLINNTIKRYLPYLHDSLSFDDLNTRTALRGTSLVCPPMDRGRLADILSHYKKNYLLNDLGESNINGRRAAHVSWG